MKNYELMELQTASGTPILSTMVRMMCYAYLDYVNNYLCISSWAEAYGVIEDDITFYKACKSVYYGDANY
jgi:hypothetical protein